MFFVERIGNARFPNEYDLGLRYISKEPIGFSVENSFDFENIRAFRKKRDVKKIPVVVNRVPSSPLPSNPKTSMKTYLNFFIKFPRGRILFKHTTDVKFYEKYLKIKIAKHRIERKKTKR